MGMNQAALREFTRMALARAQQENRQLSEIERLLEAGAEPQAFAAMREFFVDQKKPVKEVATRVEEKGPEIKD